ncbi:MAG TPA: cobalamin biosynthesis protein CbiM [Ruminococcaceae bacterium]|nr:cobalamin biosynthesis protein CbiM [Oscillospiraceae bacterium]
MHIPENYLSPATCAVMTAAMTPIWTYAVKKVKVDVPIENFSTLGIGASFSFLAMMFNVPMLGGTTGHAVGGTLIALLLGPNAACISISTALLLQAVLFGDGGILSFGANCFNMAFVLPYLGYAVYCLLRRLFRNRSTIFSCFTAAIGSYVGLNAAALCAAIEFGIQPMLFKDALGQALYCPYDLSVSVPAMMLSHLAIAGIVEAVFTASVYAFIRKTSPHLIASENKMRSKERLPLLILPAVLVVATPIGLLADGTAWGEWSAEEIAQVVTGGESLSYTPNDLANGWSLKALMPDYTLNGVGEAAAYLLSAIIGVAVLIILFKLISIPMKEKKMHYDT